MPNSCRLVLPTRIAPARRSRPHAGASSAGTYSASTLEPAVDRTPAVSTLSFTATGIPNSRGGGATGLLGGAWASTTSPHTVMKQLSLGSSRSIRERCARTTSTARARAGAATRRGRRWPGGTARAVRKGSRMLPYARNGCAVTTPARSIPDGVEGAHRFAVRADVLQHLGHQGIGDVHQAKGARDPVQVVRRDLGLAFRRRAAVAPALPAAASKRPRSPRLSLRGPHRTTTTRRRPGRPALGHEAGELRVRSQPGGPGPGGLAQDAAASGRGGGSAALRSAGRRRRFGRAAADRRGPSAWGGSRPMSRGWRSTSHCQPHIATVQPHRIRNPSPASTSSVGGRVGARCAGRCILPPWMGRSASR